MKMERTILFFLITTYHFEEEAGESINIRKTGFSSKQKNNDGQNDAIKMIFF